MHHPDVHMIEEHMQVTGADGRAVGMVDKLEDGQIKMTKQSGGGVHRYLPVETVAHVRGGVVMLKMTAEEAESRITTGSSDAPRPSAGVSGQVAAEAGMLGGERRDG